MDLVWVPYMLMVIYLGSSVRHNASPGTWSRASSSGILASFCAIVQYQAILELQMHLKGYRIFQATPQAAKFGLLHRVLAEWPGSFFTIIPDRLQLPLKVLDQHEQHENQANLENFGTGIGPAPVQPLKRFASDCDLRGAGVNLDHKKRKVTFAIGVQLADQVGQNSNLNTITLAKLQTDCRSLLGEIFAGQPAGKGYDQAALKNDFKMRFGYELDNKAVGYKSLGMFLDVTMPELQRTSNGVYVLFLPAAS
ncbi:unnamed protein product [Sphagnum troendelagicum]